MVKILQPIPMTCPSFLYSMAGAATELANPVMGTRAPAPPHLAMRPYRLRARQEGARKDEEGRSTRRRPLTSLSKPQPFAVI